MHIPLSHYSPTPCYGMRWARIAAMLAMLAPLGTLSAQDYPQKDSTGATIYYKIFSASPLYEGMCLQDNTRTDTQYPFGLAAHEAGSRQQEWTLVPGTTEGTYLLKNRATYRFVAAAGNWVDAFFVTIMERMNGFELIMNYCHFNNWISVFQFIIINIFF